MTSLEKGPVSMRETRHAMHRIYAGHYSGQAEVRRRQSSHEIILKRRLKENSSKCKYTRAFRLPFRRLSVEK